MKPRCTEAGCERQGTLAGPCLPHKFENGIRVNGLMRYRNDRDMGLTQMGRYRETIDMAKKDGTAERVALVRGRRMASEKKTSEGWQKV